MKKSTQPDFHALPVRMLAAAFLICLGMNVGLCQPLTSPGQSQQFNRIGYTVPIAQCYSATAAANLGGEQNLQVDMYNACAGANAVQQNSGTGAYWHIAGYFMSSEDPNGLNASASLSAVTGYPDVSSFASSVGAGDVNYVATYTDDSGIAQQPGFYSTVAAATGAYYVVFAHEVGHNFGCNHADGVGGTNPFRTIMLHNYCPNSDISYYSNPSVFFNGVQLLGSLAVDCGTGSLNDNGNNARTVALAAPGKQGSRPSSANTANAIYHWTFTNAPGAIAAGTTVSDQFGNLLTVRGNGATFTGTGLRLPGGTNGNVAANSIAAYLDLTNGILSSLTNATVEIWATPISGKALERLFSFGQMSGPGDGLGATGEWTGTPGTPAPGNTTAVSELGLALATSGGSLATETMVATANSSSSSVNIAATTAAGTTHYYAMTFQDGVGAFGANGGRITCYRDDDGNPTSFLDVNFHLQNLSDVNAWLGRSQFSSNAMANIEYSEVRISNVALTPQQIYGNYLLGGGNTRALYNPLLTAVHCGGAGVQSYAADQRTFAADQGYSGGTAWNANAYGYAVDVSGVANPAPQTAYQDQRYGNMAYTFTNYKPGTNYLVRLHCMECCWTASGQRVFNVFINGQKVLTNFDIYATAGAQNRAVIKEIMATANLNGQIVVGFSNVVDNASINAIEILQGGLFVPPNVSATAGNAQVTLSWSPVAGATSYNVKRATVSGGPYVTVGNTASTTYTDNPLNATTTYYYVISAVNGGNESFNSLEVSATTPVTVNTDTWVGNSGNNFSTIPNWIYSVGSGPVSNADALVFDSVGSVTPNNDEASFGYSTITYNPGAQSYTVGGNAFSLGTNSVGAVITVNSTNPQTINNTITLVNAASSISTASGNLTLGGSISGSGSLAKTGPGTLTLSGAANNLTGGLSVGGGSLTVPASGTITSSGTFTIGNTANNAVLNVSSGHLSGLNYNIGTVSGAVGAVYQTGGTVTATQAANSGNFQIGNAVGAYGYYNAAGGTLALNEIGVGGEANSGNAIMDIRGATVNDTGWVVVSRAGAAQTGILNVFSGALNYGTTGGGGLACNWGSGQTAIINMMGGTVANTVQVAINLNHAAGANTGILNLNGGSIQGDSVVGAGGRVNFNGGTLKASEANTGFMTGLASANIYAGGGVINNNGFAITVAQPLLAPAGNGVNSIASFTGGAGYIAPPIITITPGAGDITGTGATAIAQINPQTGVVTNIVITCPGVNYTATPTFTVSGGGAATAATITSAAPTPNTSGGLISTGTGTLTLSSAETYGGNTTINSGTLKLATNTPPVLHLSFDNVSGSTVVNQGSGGATMNGTLTGTASIAVGQGKFGNALSIGAALNAGYVLITNPVVALTGSASWTIGMWLKTTTAGAVYAYQGSGGWASGNMVFHLNNGSTDTAGTKAGGVSYAQGWEEGSTTINDGNWHFVAMTCNGSTKAMYVDGNVDNIASSWAAATGVGTQLWIGACGETGDGVTGLNGLIDEVYVYNRALSQAEIQSLAANNSTVAPVLPTTTAVLIASGATLDAGGLSQTIASLTGPAGSKVILADTGNATGVLTVGNTNNTIFGGIMSSAGSLNKVGAGTLTLSGANTYTGNTIVSAGTLALSGSASITSPAIIIGGGTFDVSGLAGGFTLGSGQTLSNATSTANLSGNASTGSGTVSLLYAGTPPLNVTNGTLTLASGTTFQINNTGPALTPGTYNIISVSTADNVGLVTGTAPSSVTVGGNGIVAGAAASLQISGGQLNLVVFMVNPQFNPPSLGAGGMAVSGSGGSPNKTYYILMSTNVTLPLNQWTPLATNQFDSSGNFNFTNALNNSPQSFYLLQLP